MAAETLTAAPNFIAFFNVLAGGPRGGIAVLGDSNLDWGQDLGALRRWQQANSPRRLYVLSFGPFDPADVGIQCERAWISSRPGQPAGPPRAGAGHVLAISATHLQGTYLTPDLRMEMLRLRHTLEPIDVLGGTIYLYDLDQPAARRLYASDGAAP
jgi:hypothetical protein